MELLPDWQGALPKLYSRINLKTTRNSDGCLIWGGAVTGKKYPAIRFQGKLWAIHRLLATIGRDGEAIPHGYEVDHTCFNMLCVNEDHLRVITVAKNRSLKDPRKRGQKGGKSGQWGIYETPSGNWQVRFRKEGKIRLGGTYKTIEEAVVARDEKVKELWPDGFLTPVQVAARRGS